MKWKAAILVAMITLPVFAIACVGGVAAVFRLAFRSGSPGATAQSQGPGPMPVAQTDANPDELQRYRDTLRKICENKWWPKPPNQDTISGIIEYAVRQEHYTLIIIDDAGKFTDFTPDEYGLGKRRIRITLAIYQTRPSRSQIAEQMLKAVEAAEFGTKEDVSILADLFEINVRQIQRCGWWTKKPEIEQIRKIIDRAALAQRTFQTIWIDDEGNFSDESTDYPVEKLKKRLIQFESFTTSEHFVRERVAEKLLEQIAEEERNPKNATPPPKPAPRKRFDPAAFTPENPVRKPDQRLDIPIIRDGQKP